MDDHKPFSPALLALQQHPPSPLPRAVLYLLLLLLAGLVLWAALGRLDVVAVAHGRLVPQSYLKIVQPAESGIIQEIRVREGEAVAAGQVLMRLDPALIETEGKALEAELAQTELLLRRIEAELAGKPLLTTAADPPELVREIEAHHQANRRAYADALAQEQAAVDKARRDVAAAETVLTKLRETLPVYREQERALKALARDGHAGRLPARERERERREREQEVNAQEQVVASARATLTLAERRLTGVESGYRQRLHAERAPALLRREQLRQDVARQRHRAALLELRAPAPGIVKDLATHTPGTVVAPGTVLLTLVPAGEPLQAEVWIGHRDVGFVHPGQEARLKLTAFPFQKYGLLHGRVRLVAADASDRPAEAAQDISGLPAYRSLIELHDQQLAAGGRRYSLAPGMALSAEVHLGRRRVLEYLLSPVRRAFHEAGRER